MVWALAVACLWCALGLLFVGLGLLLALLLDGRKALPEEVPEAFWLGWAGALALLQPLHLFLPARPAFLLALLPLSLVGWDRGLGRRVAAPGPGLARSGRLVVGLALFAVLLLLGLTSLKPPELYDSNLYHLQAIRWAGRFADVPGLANLNLRFGWASAHFPFVALLEPGVGSLRGFHLANGLLGAAFAAGLAIRLSGESGRGATGVDALDLVSIAAALSAWKLVSSPDTDAPLTLLGLVLARSVLSPTPRRLTALPVLAAAGVTLKLSFAPFAVLAVAAAFWPHRHRARLLVRPPALRVVTLAALLLAGWSARSVVLTGHLAFPVRSTALPVDYRVPDDLAVEAVDGIRGWARCPDPARYREATRGWWWIGGWAVRELRDPAVLPAVVCSLGWLAAFLLRPLRPRHLREPLASEKRRLLAAVLVSLVVWFIGAPDPRFARPQLWALLALALDGGAGELGLGHRARSRLALAGTGALSLYFLVRPGVFPADPLRATPAAPLVFPVRPFVLPRGLVVQRPVLDDRCGDAPIPCTPYPDARLRLRDPLRMDAGFRL